MDEMDTNIPTDASSAESTATIDLPFEQQHTHDIAAERSHEEVDARPIPPPATVHHACGYCGNTAPNICTGCHNMRYCSQDHQAADWQTHKLLCKSFVNFQERPGGNFRRAISLPEDAKKPHFIWIPVPAEDTSSSDDASSSSDDASSGEDVLDDMLEESGWEDARANPTGDPVDDLSDADSLDSGSETMLSMDEGQLDQGVELCLRGIIKLDGVEANECSGTKPNACVASLTSDRTGCYLRGPMVLYGLSSATGSLVDLDTTLLTLAIHMLPIWNQEREIDLLEVGGKGDGPVTVGVVGNDHVPAEHDGKHHV